MSMKASEVSTWLRQRAGKRDHREALSGGNDLVLRPGPNFEQLLDLLGQSAGPERRPAHPDAAPPRSAERSPSGDWTEGEA